MYTAIGDLFRNVSFWSGFGGWLAASLIKILINLRRTGNVDFQYLVSLGGMPSAHSAMASGVAASVGLQEGFGSHIFLLAFVFAAVVMLDASTVRRATGQQAKLLNQIVDEIFRHHHLSEGKLKELLGHTRTEVFVGMLIGVAVAVSLNLWLG
jgi:uncharacterized protein